MSEDPDSRPHRPPSPSAAEGAAGPLSGPSAAGETPPDDGFGEGRTDEAAGLGLDIVVEAGDWSAFGPVEEVIRTAAAAVAAEPTLEIGCVEACLALSSDARVRELNRTYRGKDKATNVLSFPSSQPLAFEGPTFLGDIILAAETVLSEARDQGLAPRHHLQHLVVHGLLHLLGFDHVSRVEADEMESLETAILARIGVPDPYGDSEPDAPDEP